LSKLDEAMRKHIEYLVLKEGQPFSFHDFLNFEVDRARILVQPLVNYNHKMLCDFLRVAQGWWD
jgi:hypothetical protein